MNESTRRSGSRSSSKESAPVVSIGNLRSPSMERKINMAEAFLVMSVRSLSSPLHNADKLYGSAAADHSVVTVPPSVADILAKSKMARLHWA